MEKRILYFLLLIAVMAFSNSCSKDEGVQDVSLDGKGKVSLLASVNGLGDNGYNDGIANGVMSFCNATKTNLSILRPEKQDEAKRMFDNWVATEGVQDSSILIINNAYESFITPQSIVGLGTGCQIFVLDGLQESYPDGVSNVRICRYGASYLAGAMSQKFDALLMLAMPNYPILEEAKEGFLAGYNKYKEQGRKDEIVYIADDESGFANPDSAHHLLSEKAYDQMIFPLLGGSVSGVVNYLNYDVFAMPLMIGMDIDQSNQCSRVPFSLVIHTDNIVQNLLAKWKSGEDWASLKVCDLANSYVEIILNADFQKYLNIWDDRYEDDIFSIYYEKYLPEALEAENKYLSKNK